jgi:hypothetical protein
VFRDAGISFPSRMNVISFFSSFLPGKIAGDVSFFLLFIGGSLALAFVLGRTRIISVVVFSYVAFAFVETIPATMFSFAPEGKAMIFLGLLVFFGRDRRLYSRYSHFQSNLNFFLAHFGYGVFGLGTRFESPPLACLRTARASISLTDRS